MCVEANDGGCAVGAFGDAHGGAARVDSAYQVNEGGAFDDQRSRGAAVGLLERQPRQAVRDALDPGQGA